MTELEIMKRVRIDYADPDPCWIWQRSFDGKNPIVFDFFRKNFEPVKIATMPGDMIALHRIQPAPMAGSGITEQRPSASPEVR